MKEKKKKHVCVGVQQNNTNQQWFELLKFR